MVKFGPLTAEIRSVVWGNPIVPNEILPGTKFTLRPSLAFFYIGSVTERHSSSGR